MSELKIHEFRERAERAVRHPDLAELERRGRALRRRRTAAVAGGLALVLAAGAGIATTLSDEDTATPATPSSPEQSWDSGLRTTYDKGEKVLASGRSTVVYDGVRVSFDSPGPDWEWWDVGVGLRRSSADQDDYAAAIFFLRDPAARLAPCRDARTQSLGSDPGQPLANVTPLLDLAHATVLREPRVVTAFGGTAVHLRLETDGGCPEGGTAPSQLRGVLQGEAMDPGWEGRQALDLWHVVVPGPEPRSMLVASWDIDGADRHRAQARALLDSVRIDAG